MMNYKEAIEWINQEFIEKPDGIRDGIIDTGLAVAMYAIEERIAILERALELACEQLADGGWHGGQHIMHDVDDLIDTFTKRAKAQAREELEAKDGE